ncbi:MAG: UDP-N-acetylmuramoyl-L-alanyl-D-glutamate--2,6-diaminopimelate ligase [Nocardioidaceae bacterium]|nr:UDP-N-acetylmuramoyl-L-alanyl-D-glutamate--2,6-diaminopimelate ligase [Nocardioidaceae bacterium]
MTTEPVLDPRPARVEPVRLADLLADLVAEPGPCPGATSPAGRLTGPAGVEVRGVTLDSRAVRPGDLYVALPGVRTHGARFAAAAVAQGAAAVLTDDAGVALAGLPADTPVLVADRPRSLLGALASRVYGRPAESMLTVGVTGTQGKTTVTYLLEAALRGVGHRPGLMGTTGSRVAGRAVASRLTTPEAPDLHAMLAVMRDAGVDACALEVSSHALVQGRVDGVVFDVAVFLNLGRDHLDFHRDTEDYFAAKQSLFTPARARRAVVDIGDRWGRRLADTLAATAAPPVTTVTTEPGRDADWWVDDVTVGPTGSDFTAIGPFGSVEVRVPLPGVFNVRNALAVVAAVAQTEVGGPGDPARAIAGAVAGLARSPGVPGRMERVDVDQDFSVVVDYAHKPDAVRAVLLALRPVTDGRLIVVIGAGGERDPGKRPLMGAVASRLSDVVVVTDDNPRGEDPVAIRAAVLAGTKGGVAEVIEIGDRAQAIDRAVHLARPGDTVLVAGKGHERGQEGDGVVHPFDDREVVRAACRTLHA